MRINVLHSLLLAPALLAAIALTAQPALAASRVNVPFNFVAAGTACPAGIYLVREDYSGNTVRLIGSTRSFIWLAGPGNPSPTDARAILNFDKIGSTHLLRSVQYGGKITSRLDRKEKEAIPAPEQAVTGQ
ncbi:MAG: hypothetical protein ACLGP3_12055 [Acidobacteriota bacterium]